MLNYPDRPPSLALLDLDGRRWTAVRSSAAMIMDAASVSLHDRSVGLVSRVPSTATSTRRSTPAAAHRRAACRR